MLFQIVFFARLKTLAQLLSRLGAFRFPNGHASALWLFFLLQLMLGGGGMARPSMRNNEGVSVFFLEIWNIVYRIPIKLFDDHCSEAE